MELPLISLFCGAGGLDYGFCQEGFKTALAVDNFQAAVDSFNLNTRGKVAVCADLSKVSAEELIQLAEEHAPGIRPIGVLGGPPCQGFSYGNVYANPDDPRNRLPFKYAALLADLNRHYSLHFFVFENVLGLTSVRHIERFKRIKEAFRQAGFTVFEGKLNSLSFGVSQSRPRLFLIGINTKLYPDVEFIYPTGRAAPKTVRHAIFGLPSPTFWVRGLTPEEIPYHPNHWTMVPKSPKFERRTFNVGRSFKRLMWDKPSPTVAYGNREIHVHPDGKRRLSVYEALRLQGFPSSFQLSGSFGEQVTQVCNAVPPPVARALARVLRRVVLRQFGGTPTRLPTYEEHTYGK